ncbi:PucR family transcriptional regulator [Paenibacillus lutrae]|uniref:PucR family transcriptional regulator n=1 Tax=Paenibacillus lutrae TaxID=2078573 RepID=A0A7X3FK53_9BACL|nr:helix-turn-helix domain-containing protein [Paenibacillus lutrae]MVP01231.1 PucR family transcriptional regulator [Paenibacillus lutrae]
MDWERLKKQLESIGKSPVRLVTKKPAEWERMTQSGEKLPKDKGSFLIEKDVYFLLQKDDQQIQAISIPEDKLHGNERSLIEWIIESSQPEKKQRNMLFLEEEKKLAAVRSWLLEHADSEGNVEMPDSIASQASLYSNKIPFLLYGDYSPNIRVSYRELKKLLETFFDTEIILVPLLEKEWLILAPDNLLNVSQEDRLDVQEESTEQMLDALASGLHEMLASEWVGESHLGVHYPIQPAQSLLSSMVSLRGTIMLGRLYNMASNIHMPWHLQMEKLLHQIPEQEKHQFLEQVLKDYALDSETQSTLEHFFSLDCNVSETAKKLYIHRNTLLYRLDKFKNETGLDVRTFHDAVLVKLAIVLYKVTKRK